MKVKLKQTHPPARYSMSLISEMQPIDHATLAEPLFSAGLESPEVALFAWDDIPWDELAFPSVKWALNEYRARLGQAVFAPGVNPPGMVGELF